MKINPIVLDKTSCRASKRRGGFTLVEILVAVAIMALLLAIILVPLRLGFETYHIGTARSSLQQEVQLTMQQIGKDFSRASFVFPNSRIRGISDSSDSTSACSLQPYPPNTINPDVKWKYLPYFKSTAVPGVGAVTDPANTASNIGITKSSSEAFANTGRIDMLLQRRLLTTATPAPGVTPTPAPGFATETGEDYVVTYYPRRADISKTYDVIDNPIVLFRAQYPYRYYKSSGTTASPGSTSGFVNFPATTNADGAFNAEIDWSKYPILGAAAVSPATDLTKNRDFLWITHNYYGEANLEPLTQDVATTPASALPTETQVVPRSHTLAIPRGIQLIAPKANTTDSGAYMPELSFVESSSNGKRIDRVTVSMTLAQYDQAGAASVNGQGKAQRVPVTQTFDLPNAGCSN